MTESSRWEEPHSLVFSDIRLQCYYLSQILNGSDLIHIYF